MENGSLGVHIFGFIALIIGIVILIVGILAVICSEKTIMKNRRRLVDKMGVDYDDIFWND